MARGKYKRQRERKMLRATMIDELMLPPRVFNSLKSAGINTLADLICYSEDELKKIPGIGTGAMECIRTAITQKEIN